MGCWLKKARLPPEALFLEMLGLLREAGLAEVKHSMFKPRRPSISDYETSRFIEHIT